MEVLLLLLMAAAGSALVACSHLPVRQYHFIKTPMSWDEAQQYCRQHYSDLATFESMEENQQLDFKIDDWTWIGLYDDTNSWKGVMSDEPNSWRWSHTGQTSPGSFQAWTTDEPNYSNHDETCVVMSNTGEWRDQPCSTLTGFICFTDSSPRSYEYISTPSTWAEAQSHCREHYTDLAVIESSEQNSDAHNSITMGSEAWIGLYRMPWMWSDKSPSSFRNWGNSPNYPYIQHCVNLHSALKWDDDSCSLKYPLICQTELKQQSLIRLTMKTSADITELLNNEQIVQKVEEELKSHRYTDFRLKWKIRPLNQTTEHTPDPQCQNIEGEK